MIVGVPREIKDSEQRVSVTPAGVAEYVHHGHRVVVERAAGAGSGFSDNDYTAAGAEIIDNHEALFAAAEMIVKVKEPVPDEYPLLQPGHLLFTFLHLAADIPLARALINNRVTAVAYETVQLADGSLPLLTPMSEVAGRMSAQVAAHYLEAPAGGGGHLMGGVPGVPGANVVVIGGGVVGTNAAQVALGMGASVIVVDRNVERLRYLDLVLHGRIQTLASNRQDVATAVTKADVVIGAVLIPGSKAPRLVAAEMVRQMRPGSVVIDVAIDQGGCIETARPTSHSDPIYYVDGVLHYCVTNMPGAVPHTSTVALANATLPYGLHLADRGLVGAIACDEALALGVNTVDGKVTHHGVGDAIGAAVTSINDAIDDA